MDEQHLLAAVRYVELNPVRAGLCHHPAEWSWSSVHAHLNQEGDELVTAEPMLQRLKNWKAYLEIDEEDGTTLDKLRQHERTERPMGGSEFLDVMEQLTRRSLKRKKPGPKVDN